MANRQVYVDMHVMDVLCHRYACTRNRHVQEVILPLSSIQVAICMLTSECFVIHTIHSSWYELVKPLIYLMVLIYVLM